MATEDNSNDGPAVYKYLSVSTDPAIPTRLILLVAGSRSLAGQAISDFAALYGLDPRWTDAVEPVVFRSTDAPAFLAWIECPKLERYSGRVRRLAGPLAARPTDPSIWRWQLLPEQWTRVPGTASGMLAHVTAFAWAATAGEANRMLAKAPPYSSALPAPVPLSATFGVLAWVEA